MLAHRPPSGPEETATPRLPETLGSDWAATPTLSFAPAQAAQMSRFWAPLSIQHWARITRPDRRLRVLFMVPGARMIA